MKQNKTSNIKRHCMVVFAPYPLGETRVQREAEALLRAGYQVDVICLRLRGEPAQDEYKGVSIYREAFRMPWVKPDTLLEKFSQYLRFFFTASVRLNRLHARKHYQSIQVHNLPDFLVFCTLLPRLQGVPVLLDLHDLMPEFFAGRFGSSRSIIMRLILYQERLSCAFAQHVITVSEHWRQALIKRGVKENQSSTVMNLADERIFSPLPVEKQRRRAPGEFKMIYHGSIKERFGLDLIIKAVDLLKQDIPHIHFTLVGSGEYLSDLVQQICQTHLEDYVSVLKPVVAEELPDLIGACDVGIVPYHNDVFTDGLVPTKLMEYAALGIPAIASKTSAISYYFTDTNVELFEPGSLNDLTRVILFLYQHPERMADLTCGSQKFNQRYNWSQSSAEYVSLIDRLGNPQL